MHSADNAEADMSAKPDMGFNDYINSLDCMIMGRKSMDIISSFNLTGEQWPYGDIKIYALSHSIAQPPENLVGRVEMYDGDINTLIDKLSAQGLKHAYIDGGKTICSFINLQLINEMIITRAPVFLGEGIPLFSGLTNNVKLEKASSETFPNDFIQVAYQVKYD